MRGHIEKRGKNSYSIVINLGIDPQSHVAEAASLESCNHVLFHVISCPTHAI